MEITQQTALVCVCVCLSNSSEFCFHHTPSSPFPFFAAWWCNVTILKNHGVRQWEGWQPKYIYIYIYIYYYIMDNNPAMFLKPPSSLAMDPLAIPNMSIPGSPSRLSSIASNMVFSSSSTENHNWKADNWKTSSAPEKNRQLSSLLPSNIFNQPFLKVSKSILKDRSIILVRAKGGTVQKFWSFWGLLCTFKSGWKRRVPMLGQQLATATWLQPKTRSNFLWGWHHHQQVFRTLVVCS